MIRSVIGVNIFNKKSVSDAEVVEYLETLDAANQEIVAILSKKPSYPDYKKLPWYLSICQDKLITEKLKDKRSLVEQEKERLKETLKVALAEVKKIQKWSRGVQKHSGLEKYINKFD